MNATRTKPTSCLRKTSRRTSKRRSALAVCGGQRRRNVNVKGKLSAKLEALKKLIPAHNNNNSSGKAVKADELFQETADYIVLLKAQVVILQSLIDFYGSGCSTSTNEEQNRCGSSS